MKFELYKAYNKCFSYFQSPPTPECNRLIIMFGSGGTGKTFLTITKELYDCYTQNKIFGLIVETAEQVSSLCANNGDRLFAGLRDGWERSKTRRAKKLLELLPSAEIDLGEKVGEKIQKTDKFSMHSGTLKVGNQPVGFVVSYNAYAKLKGTNSVMHRCIIDEFIPEKVTAFNRDIDKKIVSLLESLGRDRLEEIVMLANPVRMTGGFITAYKLQDMKVGEYRKLKDENGELYGIAHWIDPSKMEAFMQSKRKTLASKIAIATGNTYRLEGTQQGVNGIHLWNKPKMNFNFAIKWDKNLFGVIIHPKLGYFFKTMRLTAIANLKCPILTTTKRDIEPNVSYDPSLIGTLYEMVSSGQCKFTDYNSYTFLKDVLKLDNI